MSSPLVRYPGREICLDARLFGPAAHYALLAAYPAARVRYDARWDKRAKTLHRYDIADTRGRLVLTVPVSLPPRGTVEGPVMRRHVRLSDHGEWWRVQRIALESAYGRTPYFEFVADRFLSLLADPGDDATALTDLLRRADAAVCDFLGIDTRITDADPAEACAAVPDITLPYTQVRQSSLGFIPSLSILDTIFNLGPETPLYLHRLAGAM